MAWQYTADIPAAFFCDLVAACRDKLGCDPLDMARPLMNESGLSYKAHNANGNAAGIFQAMPSTLRLLGYQGDWHDFIQLDADQQLPWLVKYYSPYKGRLVNATAVYMATFCPAFLGHASNPQWVICGMDGRSDGLPPGTSKIWYAANSGFDVPNPKRKGFICVQDLTDAIVRADRGPRWDEIVARLRDAQDDEALTGVIVPPSDQPVYEAPEPQEPDPQA